MLLVGFIILYGSVGFLVMFDGCCTIRPGQEVRV